LDVLELTAFDTDRQARFESYVSDLRAVFHRADQALRFRAYLRGLLQPGGRKNIESIAAAAAGSMMVESNLPQALQHFVSYSPWDSDRLLAALRSQSREARRDPEAALVIHDVAFAKKGVHSVGAHRQFDRSAGKKLNCQIGIFVTQVGPRGEFPLAARLYVPGGWLKDYPEIAVRTIPEERREPKSKAEIALALLEELRSEGESIRVVYPEAGYHSGSNFTDVLIQRSWSISTEDRRLEAARSRLAWMGTELGLDHFEGRTWHGWHHHVSLVFAAYYLLATESRTSPPR